MASESGPQNRDASQRHDSHAHISFFTTLDILSDLLSISTLFIFMLMAVALLVRRYYVTGETTPEHRNKLVVFLLLIIWSSIATAAYWGASEKGWIVYCISVPIWFLSTVGIWVWVPQARKPKLWGVPWLPSASIAVNIFLVGSIDKQSFMRFGIWAAFLLVYYSLFGLQEKAYSKVEEGQGGHGESEITPASEA